MCDSVSGMLKSKVTWIEQYIVLIKESIMVVLQKAANKLFQSLHAIKKWGKGGGGG